MRAWACVQGEVKKMKAYGVRKADTGCCLGHDKYPADRYNCTKTVARKRAQKSRKHHARQENRKITETEFFEILEAVTKGD